MSDYRGESYVNSIAIIGMSCRFPGAQDYETFWKSIIDGMESISSLSDRELLSAGVDSELLQRANYVKFASLLKEAGLFDADFFGLTAREATITSPAQRWSLACAYEAFEDAGYSLDTCNRNVGVFLGVNRCDEWQKRLHAHADLGIGEFARQLQLYIANDLDYAATRISYKLNLTGPSFTLSTACSTSLVAVHQACRSLLNVECDMALAGGSNIVVSLDRGYLYEPGGIQSSDGHCRAFDAESSGTIFGNGVGIVLLKRLEDALEDGDHIHAIIRASAINNDGAAKVGYTAPSVTGQCEVISAALALADVNPGNIRYVEAHGTGTSLGDPIEIEALSQAYRSGTAKKQYCAVGSVKTNIGHLGAAAGVAGLIKAVQALRHRQIPPSLHFRKPNREIDFSNTPFYVATAAEDWKADFFPRYAAVSSFGVGGTNAHAIVEEAPLRTPSISHRKRHLLTLSARTPQALVHLSQKLADHLEENIPGKDGDLDFADIGYTTNVGRRAFAYRRSLVAHGAADTIAQLRTRACAEEPVPTAPEIPGVVFMFPGQGAQYQNMTLGLYECEPQYARIVDECANMVHSIIGIDILKILFSPAEDAGEKLHHSDPINSTEYAQPALFITEYALAKLLQTWGIRPAAFIGHSIGEYVAACLAGVFGLRDALELVIARGRLMASMPTGTMLAVSLSEEQLRPRIGSCDIASINGPDWCVVAGPTATVLQLLEQLEKDKVVCRRLSTSHAFHSAMMEPVLAEFKRRVAKVKRAEPVIPFVSNVTGTWIAPRQATDPGYWAAHLRSTVNFYAGAKTLLDSGQTLLVEVGPGKTLSSLISGFLTTAHGTTLVSLCRQAKQPLNDQACLLEAIGKLWTAGVSPDYAAFHRESTLHRVPLPTYPFDYERFWLEKPKSSAAKMVAEKVPTVYTVQEVIPQKLVKSPPPRALAGCLAESSASARLAIIHELLMDLCCSIFGIGIIAEDIALVELGMSSLMAIELRTKLNAALGFDCVAVVDLLEESATINNIAARLSHLTATPFEDNPPRTVDGEPVAQAIAEPVSAHDPAPSGDAEIPVAAPGDSAAVDTGQSVLVPEPHLAHLPFPLTDIQQAYWIGRNSPLEGAGVATYAYLEIELRDLDMERYEAALNQVINRHAMLRMVVQTDGQQKFLEAVPHYSIPMEDLTGLRESQRAAALAALREQMSHQVLDTAVWPLFEVKATRLPGNLYRLHYGFDFMIVDVLSLLIFFRDLFLYYADEAARLSPLHINFRDYVNYEIRGKSDGSYQRARQYWIARLADIPAAPQLPQTMPADQIVRPRYKRRDFTLGAATWSDLKQMARRHKLTPSALIATAFSEVLVRWCQSPRFTLNLTIFNRPKIHEQINDLIGDFTSSVLLEVDMSERLPFVERARCLQKRLLTDLEHRQFNGVEVLRALNNQHGAYQSVLMPIVLTSAVGLDQYSEAKLAGIGAEKLELYHQMMDLGHAISQTSQVWLDHVVREKDGVLFCNWDALEELFPEGVLDDMFCAYYDRLNQLAGEGEPAWTSPSSIDLPAEQHRVRQKVNATAAPICEDLLHELFDRSVAAFGANTAIFNRGIAISYRELQWMAGRLAQQLLASPKRPVPGKLVGILMDKGWEQIVAVFGILYSGAAYMPIDAGLPAARVQELIQQGQVEIIITQSQVLERITLSDAILAMVIDESDLRSARAGSGYPVIPQVPQVSTDLAYVLFTSGSTGIPKGVMVSHRSAVNTVLEVNRKFAVTERDKAIFINALNFDLSVYDIFGLLSCGGTLVIPDYSRLHDAAHWLQLVADHGVTVWNTVPAIVQLFVDEVISTGTPARAATVRYFMMSGDWIPTELPRRIFQHLPSAHPISLGGPTETTVWSIYHIIAEQDCGKKSIPYGKPLANRLHRILHAWHKDLPDCPDWVVGEIYTGGRIGLAEGYWKDTEKTDSSFIYHPDTGERLYRTGDLGRFLPDGNIEFVGRADNQVKIQGHRIELGEIEFTLRLCDGVKDAVVVAAPVDEGKAGGRSRLIAFVETSDKGGAGEEFSWSPGMLTDPMASAVFKMEQHGLRRLGERLPRISLPAKPDAGKALHLTWRTLGDRYDIPSNNMVEALNFSLEEIGIWLSCLGQVVLEGYSMPKYFYPSAGSSHPIQVYLDIGRHSVSSVEPGTYYYDPQAHVLVRLTESEEYPKLSYAKQNEISLFLVSYDPAIDKIYGATWRERFSPIEAGHMENLLLSSSRTISLVARKVPAAKDFSNALSLGEDYRILRSYSVRRQSTGRSADGNSLRSLKLLERQSFRQFKGGIIQADALNSLIRTWSFPAERVPAVQLPKVYLYVKRNRVAGLAGGFYGLEIHSGALQPLRAVSANEFVPSLHFGRNFSVHRASAFAMLFVSDKRSGAYDADVLATCGFMAQSLQNICVAHGIGLCTMAGAKREVVSRYLPLAENAAVIYCLEGGAISADQLCVWTTETVHGAGGGDELEAQWQQYLKEKLPYYMVPNKIVSLEKFPLTRNGKVDRKQLLAMHRENPDQKEEQVRHRVMPRNATEETIAGIWSRVLQIGEVSVNESLFELGGDSLSATKMITEIHKALAVNLPLHKVFADPTIAGMAKECESIAQLESGSEVMGLGGDLALMETLRSDAVLNISGDFQGMATGRVEDPGTVFLTGATGFLGAYVLCELLEKTKADIYCLSRANASGDAMHRIKQSLQEKDLWKSRYLDRIIAVEGDLAREKFGLSTEIYQYLCASVDVIYHIGALVNYARSYADMKNINVGGMRSIIGLASTVMVKPIVMISTKYVCFATDGHGIKIHRTESRIPDPAGLFAGYTQTKWVAEQLAEQARALGVPITIIRPGQISGAANGKVFLPQDAFHQLLALFYQVNVFPEWGSWPDGVLDVVPVDIAARAIVNIGLKKELQNDYFHLVNGSSFKVPAFFDLLRALLDATRASEHHSHALAGELPEKRTVAFEDWADLCLQHIRQMENAASAFVLETFFADTEHGRLIKGLFLDPQFTIKDMASYLGDSDIRQLVDHVGLWTRYLEAVACEAAGGEQQRMAVV